MKEILGVPKVDLGCVVVKSCTQLRNVACVPTRPVNAFGVETEEVDGLDALVYDEWYGRLVAAKELVERHAEDTVIGLEIGCW